MYKGIFRSLIFTLLCLLVSSVAWADDDSGSSGTASFVSPSLQNDNEVCIFLQSYEQDTYTVKVSGGDYKNGPDNTGTELVYQGKQFDGSYLYKWERPSDATGTPAQITIYKHGTADTDKIYDSKPFVNHGLFRVSNETVAIDNVSFTGNTVTAIKDPSSKNSPVETIDKADEQSVFLETTVHNAQIHIWPYIYYKDGDSGNRGGDFFTGQNWPGPTMTEVGSIQKDGETRYVYKWTLTQHLDSLPTKVIFNPLLSTLQGQYEDQDYKTNGIYSTTIGTGKQIVCQQFGKVYVTDMSDVTKLDPLAKLDDPNEVSLFLEAPTGPDQNVYYSIWPYGPQDGEYYTDSISWPGPRMTYVGQLPNNNYLYKWTLNSHIPDVPTSVSISKVENGSSTNIYPDKPFTNHGYYKVDANGNVDTHVDRVVRQSDGSFATSRTTYGQRVVYEMNFGSFTGVQDGTAIQKAQTQLVNLKNLGIDVIWLMPIYERSTKESAEKGNSPYAVKNFTKVDPKYGTLDDLKKFVTAAHLLGIDVWLDFVPNHAATDNVWLTDANNFHPEYFVGYDSTNKSSTSNFVHPSSGGFTYGDVWQLDYTTQYPDGNAQNSDGEAQTYNPVSRAMRNILRSWVDSTDIDGFRFDMVSSTAIPDAFWGAITRDLKTLKPSLQFLAEVDLSDVSNRTRITPSSFQYDYAWWFNDKLRSFGTSDVAYKKIDENQKKENGETNDDYNPSANPIDLAHITSSFLQGSTNAGVDRMVYLMNHDKNWGTNTSEKYTMKDIWGDNRYLMTAYEFTMPGMPLVYNGQEQDGTVSLNYFKDTPIVWTKTADLNMIALIQELANLKHTNKALSDGDNDALRGKTLILNAYEHTVLAYERVNGPDHVMVVLNPSDQVQSTTIVGQTPGTWKRVVIGSNNGLTNPDENVSISENWYCENIPAHGYEILTYTGDRQEATPGIYFVTDDSWDTPTKHPMPSAGTATRNGKKYDVYSYTIQGDEFDGLNNNAAATDPLYFKFQEYYTWMSNTTCKTDQMFGAKDLDRALIDKDSVLCSKDEKNAENAFRIVKDPDAVKYVITFFRGQGSDADNGFVKLEIVKKGEIEPGFYLITPQNVQGTDSAKHQWRFRDALEDPNAVSDKYIKETNMDKNDLCSFTIDASQFDNYILPEQRSANAIRFRIQYVESNLKDNENQISPNKDRANSAGDYIFDGSKDNASNTEEGAFWDSKGWFTITYQPDVNKYIIQLWRTSGRTFVRVYYQRKFNYTGSTIENVSATNEDVYLYNVDAQKFLYVGNEWGTMASLLYDDLGTRLNISDGKSGDGIVYKMISTRFEGAGIVPNGHMLGIDDFGWGKSNTAFDRLDSANIFCDRNNGDMYLIEKADTVDYANTYTLRLYNTKDNRFHYIRADHVDGSDDAAKTRNTKVMYLAEDVTTLKPKDMYPLRQGRAAVRDDNRVIFLGTNNNGSGWLSYTYNAQWTGNYTITVDQFYNTNTKFHVDVTDNDGNSTDYVLDAKPTGTQTTNPNEAQPLTFTVHLTKGDNIIEFGHQDSQCANVAGITIKAGRPDDLTYGRWQFITYKDLVAKLKNDNAELYGGTTADATFLLTDQGFTRNVEKTWNTDTKQVLNSGVIKDGSESTVGCTKNAIGHNANTGMYWNAHITGKGNVYQDIDVPMYGIYRLDAYGFYHGSETDMFFQYQKQNADGSVSWSEPTSLALKENKDTTYTDNTTDVAVGKEFYNEAVLGKTQTYLNTLLFFVPQDAAHTSDNYYKIRIGFCKKADQAGDYTAVDDVHLHYNGKATFLLDDTLSLDSVRNKFSAETRKNTPVWLKRNFEPGVWNALVLPVSVSTAQLRATFGDDVQVASPYGLDDDNPYLIRFTPINLNSGSTGIEAGKFYIIRPGNKLMGSSTLLDVKTIKNGEQTSYQAETHVITEKDGTKFYDLGSHDIDDLKSTVDPLSVTAANFHGTSAGDTKNQHNGIEFNGSFSKVNIKAGSYIFWSNGKMYHINKPYNDFPGYRFFITDVDNPNKATSAKEIYIGSLSDDLEAILASFDKDKNHGGTTDGIDGVKDNTDNESLNDGIVYDISGRRVGENGNTDNLPNGVYIINGKKYIKK